MGSARLRLVRAVLVLAGVVVGVFAFAGPASANTLGGSGLGGCSVGACIVFTDTKGDFRIEADGYGSNVGHGYLHRTGTNDYSLRIWDDQCDAKGVYTVINGVVRSSGGCGTTLSWDIPQSISSWRVDFGGSAHGVTFNAPTVIDLGGYSSV